MRYKFDWDPVKERANIRRRRVSFHQVTTVFRDPNQLSISDEEHSDAEERSVTIGFDSTGVLRVIIHTFEQSGGGHMPNPHDLSAPGNKRRRKTISKSEPMKAEYDFSKAERGKFYQRGAEFSFPIYLDPDVNEFLSILAKQKQVDLQDLVNEWLRVNMKLIESIR